LRQGAEINKQEAKQAEKKQERGLYCVKYRRTSKKKKSISAGLEWVVPKRAFAFDWI
jgi:hypothetical protein